MNKILLFLLLIQSSHSFSQLTIKSKGSINTDLYHTSILGSEMTDSKLYLGCRFQKKPIISDLPAVIILDNNIVVSQIKIQPKGDFWFYKIKVHNDKIIATGTTDTGKDEEMQDYIIYCDFNSKELWNLKLEKKYEGFNEVFFSKDYFELLTEGTKGTFLYKIDYSGQILDKREIRIKELIRGAIKTNNSDFLIISESADGSSCFIHRIDKNCNIILSRDLKHKDFFEDYKILEFESGFLIYSNMEKEIEKNIPRSIIPFCYFLNQDLDILSSGEFHFEPEYYKFKSDLRLKDAYYDTSKKIFIASGIVKIVNEETNIVLTFNQAKVLFHKLFDKSPFGGCNILGKSKEDYFLLEDIKVADESDSKIKMINLEIN
jgi:hypothetical protein